MLVTSPRSWGRTAYDSISQMFRGKTDLSNKQSGGTWKSAARKAIKDVWSMGQSHLARAGETRFTRLRHAVTDCTRKQE